MTETDLRPRLLVADKNGDIYDDPRLLMLCRKGREWSLPGAQDLMPLPRESELFLLPGRHAVGLDPETGQAVQTEELAVAAFVAPGHTLTGTALYQSAQDAPTLPLFAYGAVGMIGDRFYVCAQKVDEDQRQVFTGISSRKIEKKARQLLEQYPQNRLFQHLMSNCVLRYACPAARNLCLGRYEAPLPTSRTCNARCVGCISKRDEAGGICVTPQDRLNFTPTADEIVEVMLHHFANEKDGPIYSFGQGCEGEPLTQAALIEEAIRKFRAKGGLGTINLNSNASMPDKVEKLAGAGLNSLRVSLNSARPDVYAKYYRPQGYGFEQVRQSILAARRNACFVSLNLLYFPGITDSEAEIAALIELVQTCAVNFIQLRNLNIDPEIYLGLLADLEFGPAIGLKSFRKRLKKACPQLRFGYFNPFLESKS